MCVCWVWCFAGEISTGKHRSYWPTYIQYVCLHTCKALVWAETPLIYWGRDQCACVHACTRVCVCFQREWPAPKCPSAPVSGVAISTHTLKHMCCSTPLELGQVCVCARMIPNIRNCCFERSCMALLLKALNYVRQKHCLTKCVCVCVCACACV